MPAVITRAVLCPYPPLLARELTGRDAVIPELRAACAEAVAWLVQGAPGQVIVVGPAPLTAGWDPGARLDLSAFAPALKDGGKPDLPLSVGLAALLLDQVGYSGPRVLQAVGEGEPGDRCVRLGASLAAAAERSASGDWPASRGRAGSWGRAGAGSGGPGASGGRAVSGDPGASRGEAVSGSPGASEGRAATGTGAVMLVMGDGSARRTVSAPGHLDERAVPFDDAVERAVRDGDLAALDPGLAHELMVTGRPAWQALAGAWGPEKPATEVLYADGPFGVAYLVARFEADRGGSAGLASEQPGTR